MNREILKISKRPYVDETRSKMKQELLKELNNPRKRRENFTFDELYSCTVDSEVDSSILGSPQSNYENIFSPMSIISDSPRLNFLKSARFNGALGSKSVENE